MSKTPCVPRYPAAITIRDLDGREFQVPGRTYRGLGIHQPYDLTGQEAVPIPQVRRDQCWAVVHVPSGLRAGSVRGSIRAAWSAICRVADAVDWTRSGSDVASDPECRRLSRMMRLDYPPPAEEVLP